MVRDQILVYGAPKVKNCRKWYCKSFICKTKRSGLQFSFHLRSLRWTCGEENEPQIESFSLSSIYLLDCVCDVSLPSFGDISCTAVCLLCNIMKLDGTQLVMPSAPKNIPKNPQQQCLVLEIMTHKGGRHSCLHPTLWGERASRPRVQAPWYRWQM